MFVDDDDDFERMMRNSWKLTDKDPAPPNYESRYGFGKIAFQSRQNHGDILGWCQEPSYLEQKTSPPITKSLGRLRDFSESTEVQSEFNRPSISFKNASTIQSSLSWNDNVKPKKRDPNYTSYTPSMQQGYHPDRNYRRSDPQETEPTAWNSRRTQQYAASCPFGRDSPPPPPRMQVKMDSSNNRGGNKTNIRSLADIMEGN